MSLLSGVAQVFQGATVNLPYGAVGRVVTMPFAPRHG
jgi:hypothetical protein